jgi:DNA topoisomerase-3
MRLIIAEKFSQGKAIANYLQQVHGSNYRMDGRTFVFEGKDVIVPAEGHLFTDSEPEDYNPALKDWSDESQLPCVPEQWKRKWKDEPAVREARAALQRYLPLCDEVLNGCDKDPEGQVIGDEPLEALRNSKPVKRLPIVSYSPSDVAKAFANIRPNEEFKPLSDAARARSRGDWLWGKNCSRKYIIAAKRASPNTSRKISIGRVISPTLFMLARREGEIQNFSPITHYEVKARVRVDGGEEVVAQWEPPIGAGPEQGFNKQKQLVEKKFALATVDRIAEAKRFYLGKVEVKTEDAPPPLPYSLAPLQVAAGKLYRYSPEQVAEAAQALYAVHYLITYPRGNNRYYPTSALAEVPATLRAIASNIPALAEVARSADPTRHSRAFDDSEVDGSEVASHHAILPTDVVADFDKLTTIERDIYEAICRVYIAQFYPPAKKTTRRLEFLADRDLLTSSTSSIVEAGWRPVMGREDRGAGMALDGIEAMTPVKLVAIGDIPVVTKPPRRMHHYDLIAALNNVAEFVDDPELKAELGSKARLGSESTQTPIIKKLIDCKYATLDPSGFLTVTKLGTAIAKKLPAVFQGPALTAKWERDLAMIAAGKGNLDTFVRSQTRVMRDVMAQEVTLHFDSAWSPPQESVEGGGTMTQTRETRTRNSNS